MKCDFYHILNRGVEKRKIFLTGENYLHFINNLLGLNNQQIVLPYFHRTRNSYRNRIPVLQLVDILCWCFMPNHHHIFVQEKIDGSSSLFSKKLTSAYTHYFNLKNDRNGVLFQGKSKIILIKRNTHFIYIPYYIFSNPIKLIEPGWEKNGIRNFKKVIEFLENYKYSALPDLIGKNNFPEIINKELFYNIYDTNEKQLKKDFIEWLKCFRKNNIDNIGSNFDDF